MNFTQSTDGKKIIANSKAITTAPLTPRLFALGARSVTNRFIAGANHFPGPEAGEIELPHPHHTDNFKSTPVNSPMRRRNGSLLPRRQMRGIAPQNGPIHELVWAFRKSAGELPTEMPGRNNFYSLSSLFIEPK
jgi:hypothetical protein